jgi:hypothetical protein
MLVVGCKPNYDRIALQTSITELTKLTLCPSTMHIINKKVTSADSYPSVLVPLFPEENKLRPLHDSCGINWATVLYYKEHYASQVESDFWGSKFGYPIFDSVMYNKLLNTFNISLKSLNAQRTIEMRVVTIELDSQNGFGAMVRGKYGLIVAINSFGNAKVVDITKL